MGPRLCGDDNADFHFLGWSKAPGELSRMFCGRRGFRACVKTRPMGSFKGALEFGSLLPLLPGWLACRGPDRAAIIEEKNRLCG